MNLCDDCGLVHDPDDECPDWDDDDGPMGGIPPGRYACQCRMCPGGCPFETEIWGASCPDCAGGVHVG